MKTEDQDHLVVRIAMETGFPAEVVRETYLAAFLELSADARVHVYLPLFAAKRAIARLRNVNGESGIQTLSSGLTAQEALMDFQVEVEPELRANRPAASEAGVASHHSAHDGAALVPSAICG
ncbi:DUF3562 domain-containing protein [Cupriavidus basilensis]|uniref:DUF3562 domain-containing protein n=1 Tax=Cupriavidus basilensis TaxID=68895 RepID=UPI003AF355C3